MKSALSYCSCLLLLLQAPSCFAQNQGQISEKILPEIKRVGETGVLSCTVTGQGRDRVHWTQVRNGRIISSDDTINLERAINPIIDGNYKYIVVKKQSWDKERATYDLIIRRLDWNDAGTYRCQLNLKGEQSSIAFKDGELIVMSPPAIQPVRTTQTLTVDEGKDAELTCHATGYPQPLIRWVRGSGRNIPAPNNQFSVAGETLNLTSVQHDARGIYRCIADNTVRPPAMYDVNLYINFRPSAVPVQTTYGQAQNRMFDVIIECRISGFPDPDMRWMKKVRTAGRVVSEPINDDQDFKINVLISHSALELSISEFWFQLKIINVRAGHYGTYICEGTNRLGSHSAEIELFETSECQGPSCPPDGQIGSLATTTHLSWISMTIGLITILFTLL